MNGTEYRQAVKDLGLNLTSAGHFLGLTERTSARYASGGAPLHIAMLLKLMIRHGLKPEEVTAMVTKRRRN